MQHIFSSLRLQSICLIILFIIVSWNTTTAQAPQKMSYQSVIRDAGGDLVTNSPAGVKLSIVRDSTDGTVVYEETHSLTTNTNGLATLEIGTGTVVTGVFDTLDWSEGPYFLKTETDPEGGTNYTVSSINQLMSVPYALHAGNAYWDQNNSSIHNENAGNVGIGTSIPDPSALLELQSDSSGLLIPRMDSTQREAIPSPATGLMVYQTDGTAGYYYFDGIQWIPFDFEGRLVDLLEQQDIQCFDNPVLTDSLGIGPQPQSVAVQGDYAYVVDSSDDDLKVIDVDDPTNQTFAGSLGLGSDPVSVVVQGDYAYVVESGSVDLKVIDVNDPSNPTLVGSLSIGLSPISLAVQGTYVYVGDINTNDLRVIDVSDSSNPTQVGSLSIGINPLSIAVQDDYAYVLDGIGQYRAIDVSTPSNPVLAGSSGICGGSKSLVVRDNYAYVVCVSSFVVIDVSNPTNPTLAGSLGIGPQPQSVTVQGDYAYVVDIDSDDLKVINVSDPSNPSLAGSLSIGPFPQSIAVQGDYAYVVDEASDDLKVIGFPCTDQRFNVQLMNDSLQFGKATWKRSGKHIHNSGSDHVGIGTSTPGYKLQVGESGDGTEARANAWNTFSDRRWKTDLQLIGSALEKLESINGYYYKWKDRPDTTRQVGVIAQEIEQVLPEVVSIDPEGYKSVDYGKLSALLIEAVKEQQKFIEHLKAQSNRQQDQIEALQTYKTVSDRRLDKLEELMMDIVQQKDGTISKESLKLD